MSLWFKHDAHFHEHPKCLRLRRLAGAKADSAEVGWWRVVAAAKRVGDWTFEDEEHLRDAAGRYYGFVRLYREVGLLDDLTIHNGEEYQGPMTGRERVALHRSRNAPVVTPDVTHVTPRVEKSREEKSRQGASVTTVADPAEAYWSLTGRFPTEKPLSWIDDLTRKYGAEAVIRALVKAHTADRTAASLLGRSQDLLRSEARQLDRQERDEEQARLREKRAQPRTVEPWRKELADLIEKQYGDAA